MLSWPHIAGRDLAPRQAAFHSLRRAFSRLRALTSLSGSSAPIGRVYLQPALFRPAEFGDGR